MKAELAPGDDPAEITRRGLTGQGLDPQEAARREAVGPLRLFQEDTFERAARRPPVSLG